MIKITAVGIRVIDKKFLAEDFGLIKAVELAGYDREGKPRGKDTPILISIPGPMAHVLNHLERGDEIHVHGGLPFTTNAFGDHFTEGLVIQATDVQIGRKNTEKMQQLAENPEKSTAINTNSSTLH